MCSLRSVVPTWSRSRLTRSIETPSQASPAQNVAAWGRDKGVYGSNRSEQALVCVPWSFDVLAPLDGEKHDSVFAVRIKD